MNRNQEIAEWLSKNEYTSCIILDDMESKYVDPELPNVFFFRTQHQFGLTEENVDFIMSYLKGLP
jgi:predicted ATP-grasp superfamily ATP-dependent carboligase